MTSFITILPAAIGAEADRGPWTGDRVKSTYSSSRRHEFDSQLLQQWLTTVCSSSFRRSSDCDLRAPVLLGLCTLKYNLINIIFNWQT